MSTNEMLRRVLRDYGFKPSPNDDARYVSVNGRDKWVVTTYENDEVVVEVWQALSETDVTVNFNDTFYPYSVNYLFIHDLKHLQLFDAEVSELNYERVVFAVGENTFAVVDLEEVCKQYQIKRKIIIVKAFEI